jgi:hypothetical protein
MSYSMIGTQPNTGINVRRVDPYFEYTQVFFCSAPAFTVAKRHRVYYISRARHIPVRQAFAYAKGIFCQGLGTNKWLL